MTAHTADEIIEAMARAIHERNMLDHAAVGRPLKPYDALPSDALSMLHDKARAAYAECLRRLREPRPAHTYASENADLYISQERYWRAEIDARLKELG